MGVAPSPFAAGRLPRLPAMVGRERELAAISALLDRGERMVSVLGPAGVGKTRLALEVAIRSPLPALVVGLSAVMDATTVVDAVVRAAGWQEADGLPAIDVVRAELADRAALVVLDTAEHLTGLADELEVLLDAAEGLTLLVTSRRSLRAARERPVSIEPLPVPDVADVASARAAESVALLVQTARRDLPDFEVDAGNVRAVVEICRRLDGLPLAIELAGARLRLLEPHAMLELLARPLDVLRSRVDADVHDSLRAAIEWSVDLLDTTDRACFTALGVFRGSFDVPAVAAVLGVEVPVVLDSFDHLVDHHLVRPSGRAAGERRFELLDTLRDYAVELLVSDGRLDEYHRAHAQWCVDVAERMAPELEGPDAAEYLGRLDTEFDDVRAALAWLDERAGGGDAGSTDLMVRLAAAMWRYWWVRGRAVEGGRWLDRALERAGDRWTSEIARGWCVAGELAEQRGDLADSAARFGRAAEMYVAIGDDIGAAEAWNGLGMVARTRGDLDAARTHHERALAVFVGAGLRRREATTLHHLAAVAYYVGDLVEAARLWTETLDALVAVGDERARGVIISNLGSVQIGLGELRAAMRAFDEAIEIAERHDDRYGLVTALANAIDARLLAGVPDDVDSLLDRAQRLAGEIDHRYGIAMLDHHAGRLAALRGDLGGAAASLAAGWRALTELDISAGRAGSLEHIGAVAAELGRHEDAAVMLAAAGELRRAGGSAPLGPDAELVERWTGIVEDALGEPIGARRPTTDIGAVVDAIVLGAYGVHRPAAARVPPEVIDRFGLTAREAEVAELLLDRRTDREIAEALYLSRRTVTTHVASILRKLGVPSRRHVSSVLVAVDA